MANWCSTSYSVCSENKELLQKICNAINECAAMEEPLIPDSSPNWIGNIFKKMDIKAEAERTFWSEAKIENGVLKFSESSAWSRGYAIISLQDHFCKEDDDSFLSIYFVSEELGQEIYETNDESGEFYPERYCWYGDDGDEYFNTFEELKKHVQDFLEVDTDFKDVEEINEALEEAEDEVGSQHVYEISFVDLE